MWLSQRKTIKTSGLNLKFKITTMNKIKIGIVGTGFIGPAHIEALRRLPNVEVAALCEVTIELAEAKAKLSKYLTQDRHQLQQRHCPCPPSQVP